MQLELRNRGGLGGGGHEEEESVASYQERGRGDGAEKYLEVCQFFLAYSKDKEH